MRGTTLPEVLVVLLIIGVLASLVLPPLFRSLDRVAVDEAASRYGALHERARSLAISRGKLTRLELDSSRGEAVLALRSSPSAWDTLEMRSLGRARLSSSQILVVFSPIGIGFGASNTRIVFTSGTAAETLFVSRTGRLRRS